MNTEIEKRLFNKETGFFDWWDREDRLDLYQTAVAWPIITTPLNGFGVPANWVQKPGLSKIETLFDVMKKISHNWKSFYIQNPDDAFSKLAWHNKLDNLVVGILDNLTAYPSEQVGASYLGLYFDSTDDLILFTYAPGEMFRISLFGKMKELIQKGLTV